MAKVKFNISLEDSTKDYCQEQANKLGVSMSGFINVVIAQYRQAQESLTAMNNVEIFKKLADEIKVIGQALDDKK